MAPPEEGESASEAMLLGAILQALSLGRIFEQCCINDVGRSIELVLSAWDTVVGSVAERQVEEFPFSSPDRAALIRALHRIYSTNWPNKAICDCILELYGRPIRVAWMERDVREVLDIAVRSAVVAALPSRVADGEEGGA